MLYSFKYDAYKDFCTKLKKAPHSLSALNPCFDLMLTVSNVFPHLLLSSKSSKRVFKGRNGDGGLMESPGVRPRKF